MVVARPAHGRAVGERRADVCRCSAPARRRRARARCGGRRARSDRSRSSGRRPRALASALRSRRGCRTPARSTRCPPCSRRASSRRARTLPRRRPCSSRPTRRRRRRRSDLLVRQPAAEGGHATAARHHLAFHALGVGLQRVEAGPHRPARARGAQCMAVAATRVGEDGGALVRGGRGLARRRSLPGQARRRQRPTSGPGAARLQSTQRA